MGAIPVNFPDFQKLYFAFKYDHGGHLEFRNIVKMPGLIQRYMKDKYLQKGPKKKKLKNKVSFQMIIGRALLRVVKSKYNWLNLKKIQNYQKK